MGEVIELPSPYHSVRPSVVHYHVYEGCWHGKKIQAVNRRPGLGDKTLCGVCRKLDEARAAKGFPPFIREEQP